jgi:hypothetical protein
MVQRCEGSSSAQPSRTNAPLFPPTPNDISATKALMRSCEDIKVFCFFSSEKKEDSSFFEKKEAKKLYFF